MCWLVAPLYISANNETATEATEAGVFNFAVRDFEQHEQHTFTVLTTT